MKSLKSTVLILITSFIGVSCYSQSRYISKVYEFVPAPGQFVNKLPDYDKGDTHEDICLKVLEAIGGENSSMISLGGYGGYVIFGFDHMIPNVTGQYDFKILGNAFYSDTNPNDEASKEGGSCEPGIVMVSYDANGNGIPDDEWYELAGSEYFKAETIHDYSITYYKPDENKIRTPDSDYPFLSDTTYIRWETNRNEAGYMPRNTFHNQSYYPLWIDSDQLTFTGTKLAYNFYDESGNGSYYVLYAYPWGYADNHPNHDERAGFKIEWAVDKDGEYVDLPGIHFVKVYTGVNQYCGWLGETSTEIVGAEDLHFDNSFITDTEKHAEEKNLILLRNPVRDRLTISSKTDTHVTILNNAGAVIYKKEITAGTTEIDCSNLIKGLYFLVSEKEQIRFIKY